MWWSIMSSRKPTVLFVDDSVDSLRAIGDLMESQGLNVITASTFSAALRAIETRPIDAIICDINLNLSNPNDRSGVHIAEYARKAKPGIPIMANTAYFGLSDFSKYEKSLFTKVYAKGGGSIRELNSRIREIRRLAADHHTSHKGAPRRKAGHVFYDTFLCHNSAEKPIVRRLATTLVKQGLRPWLDEWDLVPGHPWQEALEEIIEHVGSAAILIGKSGIGPWADREMRSFLREFVRRKIPLIPIMLPGAPATPELPLFLREFTWVDLRRGLNQKGIDRIIWGVTGKKPK
jgi:CheY-like chemotaxis protein